MNRPKPSGAAAGAASPTLDRFMAAITYQVGALKAFLDAEEMPLSHVKPHGALYSMAARD